MASIYLIDKIISKDEKINKKFSISKGYLKIKLAIALFISLIVLAALSLILHFSQDAWKNLSFSNSYDYENIISESGYNNIDLFKNQITLDSEKIFIIMIIVFVFFLTPILLFYYLFYLNISNQYILTNKRIIVKKGWIANKITSVHYNRITDTNVVQKVIDRLLRIGNLSISTAGQDGDRIILNHISNPHKLKRDLYELKENYLSSLYKNSNPELTNE